MEVSLVGKYINEEGIYYEEYLYKGYSYTVIPDIEMPLDMQHQYEQQNIELILSERRDLC